MTGKCFADTNIFVYAGSKDPADAEKRAKVRSIILEQDLAISIQVVQEFIAVAISKKRLGLTPSDIDAVVDALLSMEDVVEISVEISVELVRHAMEIRKRFQVSYWDAAIIAAAQESRCEILYSEDLSHGQIYGNVRVINPFL